MADIVFILGAGASKQGGAPLMAEFLDVADRLRRRKDVEGNEEDFERVFDVIGGLQTVHSKSDLDITNIETVFAAFEMGRILKRLPKVNEGDIDASITALKNLIVTTIETTLKLPWENGRALAPPPYEDFAALVDHLRQHSRPRYSAAIITFNYDLAVDLALFNRGLKVDYGISTGGEKDRVPLLKLHGSMNWGTCSKVTCRAVVPWTLFEYFNKGFGWPLAGSETSHVRLALSRKLNQWQHCDRPLNSEPVIVPPTWNKGEYHSALSSVWSRAAQELSEAEHIFVCGYSLPPTDAFFHHLYALGAVGDRPLQRFWVCDPDTTGAVKERFLGLLGPGARRRFEYVPEIFRDAITIIKQTFSDK